MILFRIEDVSGFDPNSRNYEQSEYSSDIINKDQFDNIIANRIKNEVNGAKSRNLHSYSKSLATCLLKYNKYTDNELHIFIFNDFYWNKVIYTGSKGCVKVKNYSIMSRLQDNQGFFNKSGQINLNNFVIDISNNTLLHQYLKKYTGSGKKRMASPEKDNEVVVFNPRSDLVVKNHMNALYIIYALQMKYGFLSNHEIAAKLSMAICQLEERFFSDYVEEKCAFIEIINYLHYCWQLEKRISSRIYKTSDEEAHISMCYDSILQYYGIQESECFEDAYDLIVFYNDDPIISLALKYCYCYLKRLM